MATATTFITSTPSTADSVSCWECSRAVEYQQALYTATAWRAIICPACTPWVAGLLGPLTLVTTIY